MSGDHNMHCSANQPTEKDRKGCEIIMREWVGLTEAEVEEIVDAYTSDDNGYDIWCNGNGVAHAVEAKLKEKNHAAPRQYTDLCGND